MGLLYGRAGRLTAENGGFPAVSGPRAVVIREDGHVRGIRPGSAAEAAGVPCGRAEAVRIVRVNGR
jgi:hypothetical protein